MSSSVSRKLAEGYVLKDTQRWPLQCNHGFTLQKYKTLNLAFNKMLLYPDNFSYKNVWNHLGLVSKVTSVAYF